MNGENSPEKGSKKEERKLYWVVMWFVAEKLQGYAVSLVPQRTYFRTNIFR